MPINETNVYLKPVLSVSPLFFPFLFFFLSLFVFTFLAVWILASSVHFLFHVLHVIIRSGSMLILSILQTCSQLLPYAADIVRLIKVYLKGCTLPELRIQVYLVIKVLLISKGLGMYSCPEMFIFQFFMWPHHCPNYRLLLINYLLQWCSSWIRFYFSISTLICVIFLTFWGCG